MSFLQCTCFDYKNCHSHKPSSLQTGRCYEPAIYDDVFCRYCLLNFEKEQAKMKTFQLSLLREADPKE